LNLAVRKKTARPFASTETFPGSVATPFRCGGNFNTYSVANLSPSLTTPDLASRIGRFLVHKISAVNSAIGYGLGLYYTTKQLVQMLMMLTTFFPDKPLTSVQFADNSQIHGRFQSYRQAITVLTVL